MSTELIKIDAEKAGGQLVTAVAAARDKISRVAVGLARDLVEVQSTIALEASLTDEAKALILAAGKLGQYELQSSDEIPAKMVIQVCVQACMRGLSLGGMQFGVSYHRGKATLFVKSAGWLQFFANSGRAGAVQVQMGKAVIVKTGERKKERDLAIAWVAGKASVKWDGRVEAIDASGDYAIGVNCEIGFSDGIDSLQAKAKRRLLQMLWHQCSGARDQDLAISGTCEEESDTVSELPDGRDWEAEKATYVAEWKALPDCSAKDLYLSVMREESADGIAAIMHDAATVQMDGRHRAAIERAADFRRQWLASREDMP